MDILKRIVMKNKRDNVLLLCILAMGFVLRIAGYDWGGTSTFQPDEGKLVGEVINMARSGQLISQAWIWVIMIFLIPIFWVHYDVLSGFLGYNFALPILSLLMMGYA